MSLPTLLSVKDAEAEILRHSYRFKDRPVGLNAATGKILSTAVRSDRDFPPFDRVTMDGIAVNTERFLAGHRIFRIEGTQPAGVPRGNLNDPSACIRVMTGTPLPQGTGFVIPRELLRESDGNAIVANEATGAHWLNVHRQGVDAPAGTLLLEEGSLLRSPEIMIAAGCGYAEVEVFTPPPAAVVSTGDEIVPVAANPAAHQVRGSNSAALVAGLRAEGFDAVSELHLPDDENVMLGNMEMILHDHRVVIISGGVSVGDKDFMPTVLKKLGIRTVFHKVRQRPGKPFWFGRNEHGALVFALPGNPVSTLVCFHRYIRPWIRKCMGREPGYSFDVLLGDAIDTPKGMTLFAQCTLECDGGHATAGITGHHGSGDYISLAHTQGFVELSENPGQFPAGSVVPFYPWSAA